MELARKSRKERMNNEWTTMSEKKSRTGMGQEIGKKGYGAACKGSEKKSRKWNGPGNRKEGIRSGMQGF